MARSTPSRPRTTSIRFIQDEAASGSGGAGDGAGGGGGDGLPGNVRQSVGFTALRGQGQLFGFSAYQPDGYIPAPLPKDDPWNAGPIRKWRRLHFTGTVETLFFEGSGQICWLPASFPYMAVGSIGHTFSNYSQRDEVGTSIAYGSDVAKNFGTFGDPNYPACNITYSAPVDITSLNSSIGIPQFAISTSLLSRTFSGVTITSTNPYSQWTTCVSTGSADEFLCVPYTEYDGLQYVGAASVVDELTKPGNYALTNPADLNPISFGSVDLCTAVKVQFDFSGLPFGNYTAMAVVELFDLAGVPLNQFNYETFNVKYLGSPVYYDVAIYPGLRSRCRTCVVIAPTPCAVLL
jgi:hypothetical protein